MITLKKISLLGALAVAVIGCSGYSEDRATSRCDAERAAHGMLFDDESYSECTSCFQSCGDDCQITQASPVRYECAN